MKTKYEWMNDGKEFELPDFNKMNPQEQIDILDSYDDAEYKYRNKKPKGVRPKNKDLTDDWIHYLGKVARQNNLDIAIFILKRADSKMTREQILDNISLDDIPKIVNQLFRMGKKIPKKKKSIEKQPEKKY